MNLYYQIDYTESPVPGDAAYFHAQFRRMNPLPYKQVYTIVDGIKGKGHFVGTYMAWGVHNNGWWGEGEIKFFIDGDADFYQPEVNPLSDLGNMSALLEDHPYGNHSHKKTDEN